ncbi:MAG: hypothetical protein PUG10_12210 [Lachnospiraceae bacterium]|nr:hypothetical protein [Lachnospiraceae bacterium]
MPAIIPVPGWKYSVLFVYPAPDGIPVTTTSEGPSSAIQSWLLLLLEACHLTLCPPYVAVET